MRVYVYWNLRTGGYSVTADEGPHRGLVVAYADEVLLADVRCHINHTARVKCINAKKRVHAGFKGTLVALRGEWTETGCEAVSNRWSYDAKSIAENGLPGHARGITYNPKRDETFVHRDDRSPFHGGALVFGRVRPDGGADCFAL